MVVFHSYVLLTSRIGIPMHGQLVIGLFFWSRLCKSFWVKIRVPSLFHLPFPTLCIWWSPDSLCDFQTLIWVWMAPLPRGWDRYRSPRIDERLSRQSPVSTLSLSPIVDRPYPLSSSRRTRDRQYTSNIEGITRDRFAFRHVYKSSPWAWSLFLCRDETGKCTLRSRRTNLQAIYHRCISPPLI